MHGQDADACHRMRGVTHSRACYRRRSIYRPRTSQMMTTQGAENYRGVSSDELPRGVIFRLLDHQSLAAAPQVCTKWNALTCDDELWRKLFEDRWGADAAAFYAPEPQGSRPWKDVFVVQDRCDRYGLGVRIIREGNDYYLIYQGEIQSYLGTSSDANDAQLQSAEATEKRQISDRILFFLGDLETAYADAKRVKA